MTAPHFCPSCGAARIEDARFCGGCGADFEAQFRPTEAVSPSSEPNASAVVQVPAGGPVADARPGARVASRPGGGGPAPRILGRGGLDGDRLLGVVDRAQILTAIAGVIEDEA